MSDSAKPNPIFGFIAKAWLPLLQFILLAGPVFLLWKATKQFQYNTLFLDDWVYVPLYEKAVRGGLTMNDLFAGYLEHRIPIPKLIAIIGAVLTKGDVTTQNWVGFAALVGTWLIVGRLLWRALGSWDKTWLPWAVCGGALCSAVHWQELLWPAMHLLALPGLFLALALLFLGSRKLAFWPKLILTFLMECCAILSCAAGLSLAGLIPVAILCGYGMKDSKSMRRFLGLTMAGTAAVLGLYFYNLKSEVDPAFSYGQENGANTLSNSLKALASDPMKGVPYWVAQFGSNLSRGISEDRRTVALVTGSTMLALFIGLAIWTWGKRKSSTFHCALPFLILGGYAIGSAFLITLGRAWASNTFGGALNNRYSSIAALLTIAVIGLAAIVLHSWNADGKEKKRGRISIQFGGGALALLLLANALHGAQLMESWQAARLRSAVDVHFSQVLGLSGHGKTTGPMLQISIAGPYSKILNNLGFLERPLATDASLNQFKAAGDMPTSLGGIDHYFDDKKTVTVLGYALLKGSGRPPDGILVTVRPIQKDPQAPPEQPRIIDIGYVDQLPTWIDTNTTKDFHFIMQSNGETNPRVRRFGAWTMEIKKTDIGPGRNRIDFWALDFLKGTVMKIQDGFIVQGKGSGSFFTQTSQSN